MKILTDKKLVHKIIIAIVFVILFNFISPNISMAKVSETASSVGGILFEPIKDLLLAVSDVIMSFLQKTLLGMDVSFMTISSDYDLLPKIVGGVAAVLAAAASIAVGIAGAPFSGGLSLAAVAAGIQIAVGSVTAAVGAGLVATYITSQAIPESLKLPIFAISPEEMFKNKIALLDVNFFNPNKYADFTTPSGETVTQKSTALVLQPTISSWYYALRNFAVIALLSVLVYIGIRILISSSSQDKAKYKQRLMDWLVAMCLLFFMHYIMAFAVTISEEITKAVTAMNDDYGILVGNKNGFGPTGPDDRDLSSYHYGEEDDGDIFDGPTADTLRAQGIIQPNPDDASDEELIWPSNMMGRARVELQLEPQGLPSDEVLMRQFGYTIIYLALVIYTVLFLFRYLKRFMMLAFLTIIAPLMAMTYPIDKIKDGSAQGFNTWLKEYVYNLLIQPVHLVLYTVLVGSALDLVMDNLIYGLVALGFILQAEKLLRSFFGFNKASTVEGGSALGGALAMQGLNHLGKILGGEKHKKENIGGSDNKKLSQANRKPDQGNSSNLLMDSVFGRNNASTSQQSGANNGGRGSTGIARLNGRGSGASTSRQISANGITGSAGGGVSGGSGGMGDGSQSNIYESLSPSQRMVDSYDEGFGTPDYDMAERDTMARDAAENPLGRGNLTANEYADMLRNVGYDEDAVNQLLNEAGYNGTAQQRMMDDYDEGFGTPDYDSTERAAMAADLNESNPPEGMQYSADEYRDILKNSGYDDDQIREQMREAGYDVSQLGDGDAIHFRQNYDDDQNDIQQDDIPLDSTQQDDTQQVSSQQDDTQQIGLQHDGTQQNDIPLGGTQQNSTQRVSSPRYGMQRYGSQQGGTQRNASTISAGQPLSTPRQATTQSGSRTSSTPTRRIKISEGEMQGPPPYETRRLSQYARDKINAATDGSIDELRARGRGFISNSKNNIKSVNDSIGEVSSSAKQSIRSSGRSFLQQHPLAAATLNSAKAAGRTVANVPNTQFGKAVKYIAPKAASAALRTAVKTTLAGAGAVTGVAAGLVSDNYANVIKFGAGGAIAGGAIAGGINNIPNRVNGATSNMRNEAEKEFVATHTEDEVRARQNAIADEQFLKNPETVKKYQDEFGSKQRAKEMMKHAIEYRKYGITDDDVIIKSMKAKEPSFGDVDSEKRIVLAKMATQVGKNRDQLEYVEKALKKRGATDEEVNKYVSAIKSFNKWVV